MKQQNFFQWAFTRYYYWLILFFSIIINEEIIIFLKRDEIGFMLGYITGEALIL